jgi:hypothetical protein
VCKEITGGTSYTSQGDKVLDAAMIQVKLGFAARHCPKNALQVLTCEGVP